MKNRIVLFIVAFIIWALLHYPMDMQHTVIGIIAALLVTTLAGDLFTTRPHLFLEPQRYLWFFCYICVFVWEWSKANIKFALRLIRPRVCESAAIIETKVDLKTDVALTFLANTLTLTLETITVDVDGRNGKLYLHCIDPTDAKLQKSSKIAIERFTKIIKKIFE